MSRKYIVAGLLAALTVPAIAHAASSGPTWYEIQSNPVLRQRYYGVERDRSERSATTAKDFDRKHDQAMRQGADHNAANAAAAGSGQTNGPSASNKEWSLKHWKAMQQGADHEKASAEASKG